MGSPFVFVAIAILVIVVIVIVYWWTAYEDPIVADAVNVDETYSFDAYPDNRVFSVPAGERYSYEGVIDRHTIAPGKLEFYLVPNQPCTVRIQRKSNGVLYRQRNAKNGD